MKAGWGSLNTTRRRKKKNIATVLCICFCSLAGEETCLVRGSKGTVKGQLDTRMVFLC